MKTEIIVRVESVYGNKTIYPVNDQAKRLAALAGTKTLTPATLQHAESMGFKVVEGNVSYLTRTKDGFTCHVTPPAHFDIGVELGYKRREP